MFSETIFFFYRKKSGKSGKETEFPGKTGQSSIRERVTFADPGHRVTELVHAGVRVDDVDGRGRDVADGRPAEVHDLIGQLQRRVNTHAHALDLELSVAEKMEDNVALSTLHWNLSKTRLAKSGLDIYNVNECV